MQGTVLDMREVTAKGEERCCTLADNRLLRQHLCFSYSFFLIIG